MNDVPGSIPIIIEFGSELPIGLNKCGIVWMPCTCRFVVLNKCGLFIRLSPDAAAGAQRALALMCIIPRTCGMRTVPDGTETGGFGGSELTTVTFSVDPGKVSSVGPTVEPL